MAIVYIGRKWVHNGDKVRGEKTSYLKLILLFLNYHDHITPTLETLHWVQYKILLYVFKALKQEAPLYLEELVNIYKPARSLRSESNTTLVTPIVRTKRYGERRFDKAAASLWNDLPNELRNVQSVNVFKKKLKTHFFRQAFLSF